MVRSLQPILRRSSRPLMKWLAVRPGGEDGQLAELDARACHGRAAEDAGVHPEIVLVEGRDELVDGAMLDVGDDDLLLGREPDEAAAELVGQAGDLPELVAVDASGAGSESHVEPSVLLLMDADMVPLCRRGRRWRIAVGEAVPEVLLLEHLTDALGAPVGHEELQAG